MWHFAPHTPVLGLAASLLCSRRRGRESTAPTTVGKHPNQCMKKGGDPACHLETQPLLSAALPVTPRGIRKTALTRKLAASLL